EQVARLAVAVLDLELVLHAVDAVASPAQLPGPPVRVEAQLRPDARPGELLAEPDGAVPGAVVGQPEEDVVVGDRRDVDGARDRHPPPTRPAPAAGRLPAGGRPGGGVLAGPGRLGGGDRD